jgi:hypothetical protein
MATAVIEIDRLEIKTYGISEEVVRKTIPSLYKEISLQASKLLGNSDLDIVIPTSDKMDVGSLYLHEKDIIYPGSLARAIANKMLKSIVRVGEGGEESL